MAYRFLKPARETVVPCGKCGARRGENCADPAGRQVRRLHKQRLLAYQERVKKLDEMRRVRKNGNLDYQ